ncbi:MAG: formate dehydrogenase accessory sulfurtransferase FdhD [Syntrophaceticus sp.]|nr:formate dehydrogenase accessory sulfurtransferase FdhD [Syntrophaceticus sp.]
MQYFDSGLLTSPRKIIKLDEKGSREVEDMIVRETTLTVYVNSKETAALVCSPRDQKYLAVGFLCAEGVLNKREDLRKLEYDAKHGDIYIETSSESDLTDKLVVKRCITPSTGRSGTSVSTAAVPALPPPVSSQLKVNTETVLKLAAALQDRSRLFQRTGGVHNAALAQGEEIIIFQEDIGRHNTLDKIHGQCFLEEIPREDKIIIFSGRVSSEILLKTARMRVPILISRSAPTDLALKLAEELQITVLGFVRGERLSIYAHQERIIF